MDKTEGKKGCNGKSGAGLRNRRLGCRRWSEFATQFEFVMAKLVTSMLVRAHKLSGLGKVSEGSCHLHAQGHTPLASINKTYLSFTFPSPRIHGMVCLGRTAVFSTVHTQAERSARTVERSGFVTSSYWLV